MSHKNGIWFVFRSPNEGPFSKRVRRLEAPSILIWFQLRIDEARVASAPGDVGGAELGGVVDALSRLFRAVQAKALRTPQSMTALRKMLREQLWENVDAEATKQRVQADKNSLRILPEDDSTTLVFLEAEAAVQNPESFLYLLHDEPGLPLGESQASFPTPVDVPSVAATVPVGSGAIYVCAMPAPDRKVPGRVTKLSGVDLPRLPRLLKEENPVNLEAWPEELRALRSKFDAEDKSLAPSLGRLAQDLAADGGHEGNPPVILESDHTAQVCAYVSEALGYRQLILFDDRWAAARPDLATSLIRYVLSWDPCARLKAPAAKAKASKGVRAPKKPRPTKAALQAEVKQEASWSEGLAGRTEEDAEPYNPRKRFEEGAHILHARFGLGFVSQAELTKFTAVFEHSTRLLVHGMS